MGMRGTLWPDVCEHRPRAMCGACLHGNRAGIFGAARYRCSCVLCWLWPRAGVLRVHVQPCDCMCMGLPRVMITLRRVISAG